MDTIKQEKEEFYEKLNKKRYLKDYSIINTFKYQKYVFAKDNTCVADKYINIPGVVTYKEEIDTKEIFKDILKFGETIYKKLDLIGIEDNDLVLFENSKTFTDNDIIKKEIINLFYKYGIPFPPSNMISLEKNLISNLYNYQKNVMTFNTLHFVNLSLSIYIIYSLKDILVNVKKKKAYLFSKKLTDLHNEISKLNIIFNEDIKYNKEIVNIFKKYLIKIIFLTNNYINKYFTIKNTIVMEFNNATTVFLDEVDKDYKKLDFLTFVNLVNDPFLCAYEYLIQALPYKQNIPIMYYCDNCHSLINDNFVLCASCRIQLGSEIIKNPRKNNKHKIKTIDNELKDLKKGIISDDSEILKTYIDRRNHKKNYYKNKSNE